MNIYGYADVCYYDNRGATADSLATGKLAHLNNKPASYVECTQI